MTPTDRILIDKAAVDTGWDIPTEAEGDWLRLASARFDSRAWVSHDPAGPYRLAVSSRHLFRELARDLPTDPTPSPGVGCVLAADIGALDTLLEQRLDVFNGLLLAPHLDALFDGGWIAFEAGGRLCISPRLDGAARVLLGLDPGGQRLRWVEAEHEVYLAYHRQVVWWG